MPAFFPKCGHYRIKNSKFKNVILKTKGQSSRNFIIVNI